VARTFTIIGTPHCIIIEIIFERHGSWNHLR
jgi:hypothetical protein